MRVIILVGFSKGLGKAIFEQLLKSLALGEVELLALGRNTKNLPKYDAVTYIEADLSKDNCWELLSKQISSNATKLDVILNASVIEPIAAVGSLSRMELDDAVKVNYISPLKLINQLVNYQQKNHFLLNIFNITSGASSKAIEGWSLYCSTKAALRMFLDVTYAESKGNMELTHIDPGVIDTDMQRTIRSKSEKEMKNVHQFRELNKSNQLKSPYEAARDVLAHLRLN